jgi:alkylation response protein AidB-like acyl-CoA dehydrogenase
VAIGTGPAQTLPATDPEFTERAGYHVACGHAVALLGERGAHPAIRKLLGTAHRQAVAETALEQLGPDGAAETEASQEFLLTRCLSIAGGTTQILLTQVAERVLGLPR